MPPAPVVTPTLTCSLHFHWGFPTLCSSWPSGIETKKMRPVNEMSDMQNRKKQQKGLTPKKKRSSHSNPKELFPNWNLTLSEQTCETKKMYTTFKKNISPQKNKQKTWSNPPISFIPFLLLPRHRSSGSPVPNGPSYEICCLKVLWNWRHKLLEKLFGGTFLTFWGKLCGESFLGKLLGRLTIEWIPFFWRLRNERFLSLDEKKLYKLTWTTETGSERMQERIKKGVFVPNHLKSSFQITSPVREIISLKKTPWLIII